MVPASATTATREDRYVYGADGDPLRTDVARSIGDDTYVTSTTVDVLGRTVASTDPWGVTTQISYDAYGDTTNVVTTTPTTATGATTSTGATTTRTLTWDAHGIVEEHVVAVDGGTYTATVTDRDHAGRATSVVYSNGVTLERSFDPVTGVPTSTYTDTNGGAWTETVTATSHTGRILAHRFDTPTTSAEFAYTYDPTSGQLTNATLDVTGGHSLNAAWSVHQRLPQHCLPPPAVPLRRRSPCAQHRHDQRRHHHHDHLLRHQRRSHPPTPQRPAPTCRSHPDHRR